MRSATISSAILFVLCSLSLAAQQHPNVAKGFSPTGSFASGDVDSINGFNGNLLITLALGQRFPAGGSLSYGLTLVYNSQVWEQQIVDPLVQSLPLRTNNAGLGWMVSLGRMKPPEYSNSDFDATQDTYMSPDGARHTFYPTLHEGEPATAAFEYTRDGSYLRYSTVTRVLEFPDGTKHTFDGEGYPTQLSDRFGHQVNISYSDAGVTVAASAATLWTINDGFRTNLVWFRKVDGLTYQTMLVDRIDLAAFSSVLAGQRAVYIFNYNLDDGIDVHERGCGNTDGNTGSVAVALLTRVSLPDGSSYAMPVGDYFASSNFGTCKNGMIHGLTLPTLGRIEWDYIPYRFPDDSSPHRFVQQTTGVGARATFDAAGAQLGAWTYTTSLASTRTELLNTVTDPLGFQVKHYFSVCGNSSADNLKYEYGLPFSRDQAGDGSGRFLSTQTLDTAVAGSGVLRTTYLAYEHDQPTSDPNAKLVDKTRSNQRVSAERTAFNDDGGIGAGSTMSSFDGLGHYRSRQTGGQFPSNNVRASFVNYNSGQGTYGQAGYTPWPASSPWIIGTYNFAWDAENGQLFYRSFCFEPSTGFLLGRRIHAATADGNYRTNDQAEVFARDILGNLITESYFGGDTQPITTDPVQGYVCSLVSGLTSPTYSISHTYASGVRSSSYTTVNGSRLQLLDQDIDASTGLPWKSRDAAGSETVNNFDTLGRIVSSAPANGAITSTSYRRATSAGSLAQVTVSQDSGGSLAKSRLTYDAFGRVTLEEQQMPNSSFSGRRTYYDGHGNKTFVSSLGDTGVGTSYLSYDAFGRPTTIRPPEGFSHDLTLTYSGTRQVTRRVKVATSDTAEANATTTEVYDRFGRLFEVTEPNNVKTQYTYDAADHLRHVCQGVSGTSCGQDRVFNYDGRGLLLSENHPEKTANVYGRGNDVDYLGFDARGHATRKVDGGNDLTFVFDKAERLTLVRETGSGRSLKSFTYGTSNGTTSTGATDYRTGKVVSAARFNYVGAPFNATVEVRESYVYAGLASPANGRGPGLVSQKDTAQTFNGTQMETFRQTFTWNDLGLLASQSYPDCIAATLCGASSPRNVDYIYAKGRVTAIPGLATSITYNPNGTFARIAHANGISDYQTPDSFSRPRPAVLYATRDSDGLVVWSTGGYQFDGSGNVWKMGTAAFNYDLLSRLTSGTVYPGATGTGTPHTQSYTFDNYGNITTVTTNGVLRNTPTTAATNRLTAGTYDAAGNLISWSGNSYEFDAFNQMKRMVTGADDWRYIYTADDERFWSYRVGGDGSLWTLRDLGGKVLREYQAHLGWTNYRDYVLRDGSLFASVASPAAGGTINHYHLDHLGTVRLITDASGSPGTAQFHTYYPFGEEIAGTYSTAYTDPFRFTGHERDLANVGGQGDDLDYMHARHESTPTGRFLSVDRHAGNSRLPCSWNRYSYTYNNPLKLVDPNGNEPLPTNWLYFYNAFFDADFSSVDIKRGFLAHTIASGRVQAMTLGSTIFLNKDEDPGYAAGQPSSIALIAHELTHVLQYWNLGTSRFLAGYLQDYSYNRMQGKSDYDAYRSIILEDIGAKIEAIVQSFLDKHPQLAAKLASGEPLTEEEMKPVIEALDEAAKDGTFKTGYQFIQGFLVYVPPPK